MKCRKCNKDFVPKVKKTPTCIVIVCKHCGEPLKSGDMEHVIGVDDDEHG